MQNVYTQKHTIVIHNYGNYNNNNLVLRLVLVWMLQTGGNGSDLAPGEECHALWHQAMPCLINLALINGPCTLWITCKHLQMIACACATYHFLIYSLKDHTIPPLCVGAIKCRSAGNHSGRLSSLYIPLRPIHTNKKIKGYAIAQHTSRIHNLWQ